MTPEKIDLYKLHKDEYAQPKKPALIETRSAAYLAIDDQGAPGGGAFQECVGALYAMAYTVKMTRKFAGEQDYTVCKLEGLYWLADGSEGFAATPKEQWCWKLMIRTPDFVEDAELERAVAALEKRGKATPTVKTVALEPLDEGRCVQMLHVGPYDREDETIAQMEAFMAEQGLTRRGRHHEIYLSDPRRVAPERLKTIIRLPVK